MRNLIRKEESLEVFFNDKSSQKESMKNKDFTLPHLLRLNSPAGVPNLKS
jgi:hypothetical protein